MGAVATLPSGTSSSDADAAVAVDDPTADTSTPRATGVEVLVARRPLTWHGRRYVKGDALDPQPTGRKREVMARSGHIVAEVDGQAAVVAQVAAIRPDGLVCPTCAKVLSTPTGLKVHRTRVHGGA
jgi:hypothetical protein